MNSILGIVALLASLGVPTIFAMTMWCIKACKKFFKNLDTLQSAQKAQMRAQLLEQYYKYKERGWIYADQLQEWQNSYNAYHQLVGENEILDARKIELIALPSKQR